jgi:Squalene-hopene cyclase C-terminal domain
MFPALVVLGFSVPLPLAKPDPVRAAVAAAVPKLVAGAAGHAEQKSCFACHNQAFPALALSAARDRGFDVPEKFFKAQAAHIADFLASNKDRFLEGKGTGGQAATASYALLALELAGHEPDDTTAAVAEYLLKFEPTRDHWRTNSNRPPTEASDFTTTYVAMRTLRTYGAEKDKERIAKRVEAARAWLVKTPAKETEDRVFRLLGLKEAGAGEKEVAAAAWELLRTQRDDGGWAQLDGGAGDAYATGSALYALHHAGGLKADSAAYKAGVAFLVKSQLPDGTWKVKSRSKPFQPYYESGFPHEKDQFISISATGWATAALAAAVK